MVLAISEQHQPEEFKLGVPTELDQPENRDGQEEMHEKNLQS